MATHAPRGDVAGSRVHLAYLTKGAVLPKHPAGGPQLFVMVSGSGLVAGDDDEQHPLGPGQAARWNAGEEHTFWAVQESVAAIV